MLTGGCHCGAIRYEMSEDVHYSAICHCTDCRKHAGAPMVSYALVDNDKIKITGDPKSYASSALAHREFCGACGSSLFYRSETIFPGKVDVQTATLDEPDKLPPTIQVQCAERLSWIGSLSELDEYERYPG